MLGGPSTPESPGMNVTDSASLAAGRQPVRAQGAEEPAAASPSPQPSQLYRMYLNSD